MDSFDLSKYLDMAKRRIYWIVIPFLCVVLGGLGYLLIAPKTYEAQTLILVQPQRVPQEYVRSIVSIDVDARLKTISQQVLSRTNLEKIIKDFELFKGESLNIEEKVIALRKSIKIDVTKTSSGRRGEDDSAAFTIAYRGPDPRKVKIVTDALASNFISENLLFRESQALGTSAFLSDELDSVRRRLAAKEEELKQYREKFMGGLPEQLETNLKIIERTQAQLDQLINRQRDLENRRLSLQKELAEIEKPASEPSILVASPSQQTEPRDLASLKNQLASLTSKYTEMHPDVIKLKKMIAQLESEKAESEKPGTQQNTPNQATSSLSRANQAVMRQIQDTESEIQKLKSEIEKTNSQIKSYQEKIEDTPKREQELLSLKRDYANLKELYDSLLKRKLEAEIAVSMEKKQQGEQFRIIDPAKEPLTPVTPDIPRIILMTLALGLGLGCGLAYGVEMMDGSFKFPDDLEKAFKVPVLVNIPFRYTEREYRSRRMKKAVAAVSIGLAFIVSATAIVVATKGLNQTLSFLKSMLEKM